VFLPLFNVPFRDARPDLRALLLSFDWLWAKLDATDVGSVIADYDALPTDDPARLVQDAVRLGEYCLAGDKTQLAGQLVGRLRPGLHADLDALIQGVRTWRGRPWLRPLRATLHGPGGPLVRVFRGYAGGHRGTIRSIAIDDAGRWAVSAGNSDLDRCLIVWNLKSGNHRKLEGQAEAGGYTPLALSPGGEVFVSAFREELRVWRVADGVQLKTLHGATTVITALALANHRTRVVYGTADGSVFRWDIETGSVKRLGEHINGADAIAIDGSGTGAASINKSGGRRWDLTNDCLAGEWATPGFSRVENARCLRISGTGRYVAWGGYPQVQSTRDEGTWLVGGHCLMAWDSASGSQCILASHEDANGPLYFCDEPPLARALVKRRAPDFDSQEGVALLTIEDLPHLIELTDVGRGVSTAAISQDGRWGLTADYEHDLILWDLDSVRSTESVCWATLTTRRRRSSARNWSNYSRYLISRRSTATSSIARKARCGERPRAGCDSLIINH
jgi:WD40 repeat protein